jgi:hypothetical protein
MTLTTSTMTKTSTSEIAMLAGALQNTEQDGIAHWEDVFVVRIPATKKDTIDPALQTNVAENGLLTRVTQ